MKNKSEVLNNTVLSDNNVPVWLIVCLVLMNNFWSMAWIDIKYYQYVHLVIFIFLIYYFIVGSIKYSIPDEGTHKKWILALMLSPLLSVYSSNVIYGRPIIDSIIVYRMHLGLLLYFVLWYKRISIDQIKMVILVLGMGYAFLTIIQQFTFPFAPFGLRTIGSGYLETHEFESRLGFARFEITGVYYAVIIGVMVFAKQMQLNLFFKVVLFLSLIASGNRRVIGISALSFSLIWIFGKNIKSIKLRIFLFVLAIFIIYGLRFIILGDLANVIDDFEEGRAHSYLYFITLCLSNTFGTFFGFGLGRNEDVASDITSTYFDDKPVILSDIGAVACWYYWGLLYIIALFGLFISLAFAKKLDKSLRILAFSFFAFLWILFLSWEVAGSSFIAMFVYMCDITIQNNLSLSETVVKK